MRPAACQAGCLETPADLPSCQQHVLNAQHGYTSEAVAAPCAECWTAFEACLHLCHAHCSLALQTDIAEVSVACFTA